ncbi:MAG: two-component sensor histidine kinase, partial [Staphylococcus sp.]|nr:two-component sensor histidine kinase [Staphylococcus sp.]
MMKNHTLQYKWMTITTLIMFTTIILFCLIIIFFLKDTLREGEVDEAEHSLSDIVNLIQTRPINNISILDLSASLENYEEVIIYNHT